MKNRREVLTFGALVGLGGLLNAKRLAAAPPSFRVVVDYDLCERTGDCAHACPEVFEMRSDGHLNLLTEEPAEELREKVERAEELCPTNAISIEG